MLHHFGEKNTSDAVINQISLYMLQRLEQNIITLVKTELQNLQKSLTPNPDVQRSEENVTENPEEEGEESSRDHLMKVILKEMRSMGDNELADCLHYSKNIYLCLERSKNYFARLICSTTHSSEASRM